MPETVITSQGNQPSATIKPVSWVKSHVKQLIGVAFWIGVIIATRQYMQANDLTFLELVNQLAAVLTGTWYGPLLYIVIYLLRPLILFPASLLTILAGSIFGLAFGFLWGLIAGTLSAAIPYIVGRWFSGDERQVVADENANALQRFIGLMKRNPFQTVLTMRLLYLPYDAVSVVAGNLRIPFVSFALATAIGNIGGSFSFVSIGASVPLENLNTGEISVNPATFVFGAVVLVSSLALSRYLNKRQAQKDAAEKAKAVPGGAAG